MIDMFDLWRKFCGRVNTAQGGHARPEGNFQEWVNDSSLSLYEEKFAVAGKSQKVADDIGRPFLRSVNIHVKDGVAKYPEDYGHYSSSRYYLAGKNSVPKEDLDLYDSCGKKVSMDERPATISEEDWEIIQISKGKNKEPIKTKQIQTVLVSNDRWGSMQTSRFAGPTATSPKLSQFDDGFRVAPDDISIFVLDYYKVPRKAVFAYTVDPGNPITGDGDYIIYDKAKSVSLEWSDLVINEILNRLEIHYAKYIREGFNYQVAENERTKTV